MSLLLISNDDVPIQCGVLEVWILQSAIVFLTVL